MKKLLVLILIILFALILSGQKIIPDKSIVLPDLVKPRYISIDRDRFYIVEDQVKITGYYYYLSFSEENDEWSLNKLKLPKKVINHLN